MDGLCAVDVDDAATQAWVDSLESHEIREALAVCPVQTTKKGRHYIFRRPDWADAEGYWDGARQHGTKGPAVDLKTRCSTGTRGVLAVSPSTDKVWLKAPWDAGVEIVDIPRSLLSAVAVAKPIKELQPSTPTSSSSSTSRQISSLTPNPDEIDALLAMLDPARAESYTMWMEVGWCLHNIGSTLDRWIAFSRQSSKFTDGECGEVWSSMKSRASHNSLLVGSLHHWARLDNPREYKARVNSSVFLDIKGSNGSHNNVAKIASRLLRDRHVCVSTNGKGWYAYEDGLWKLDSDGICVRRELSSTLVDHVMMVMSTVVMAMTVDEMQSQSSTASTSSNDSKATRERLMKLAVKLQDKSFKDNVLMEMREFLYDGTFLEKLDSNRNLIAFNNGVYELNQGSFRAATPDDRVSLTTGYAYSTDIREDAVAMVDRYWRSMHPDEDQRTYVKRMFARQLYGDHGQELFHIHAGYMASAANGKSKFFEVLENCLGNYVLKFGVEMLTSKNRIEVGKPMPELGTWRGVRILYSSEPNHDESLNTGILKDLTGGEVIVYRTLFSNDIQRYRPQFKMHQMCNDPPIVDGADSGVKRRIRKIDYISRFVDANKVNVAKHMFARDPDLIQAFKEDDGVRMAFFRSLVDCYDHDFEFEMPESIRKNSLVYLEDNDSIMKFVNEWIVEDPGPDAYFTLLDAKERFASCDYFNGRVKTLKHDLQKALGTLCLAQKWIAGGNRSSAFVGFRIRTWNASNDIQLIVD